VAIEDRLRRLEERLRELTEEFSRLAPQEARLAREIDHVRREVVHQVYLAIERAKRRLRERWRPAFEVVAKWLAFHPSWIPARNARSYREAARLTGYSWTTVRDTYWALYQADLTPVLERIQRMWELERQLVELRDRLRRLVAEVEATRREIEELRRRLPPPPPPRPPVEWFKHYIIVSVRYRSPDGANETWFEVHLIAPGLREPPVEEAIRAAMDMMYDYSAGQMDEMLRQAEFNVGLVSSWPVRRFNRVTAGAVYYLGYRRGERSYRYDRSVMGYRIHWHYQTDLAGRVVGVRYVRIEPAPEVDVEEVRREWRYMTAAE